MDLPLLGLGRQARWLFLASGLESQVWVQGFGFKVYGFRNVFAVWFRGSGSASTLIACSWEFPKIGDPDMVP